MTQNSIGKTQIDRDSSTPEEIQVGDTVKFKSSDTGLRYRVLAVNEKTLRLTNPLNSSINGEPWEPQKKWFVKV